MIMGIPDRVNPIDHQGESDFDEEHLAGAFGRHGIPEREYKMVLGFGGTCIF
jgi:hypothetical protein